MSTDSDSSARRLRRPAPPVAALLLLLLGGVLPGLLAWLTAVPPQPDWLPTRVELGPPAAPELPGEPRQITAIQATLKRVDSLQGLYRDYAFDLEAVAAGDSKVPPIFIQSLPRDWSSLKQVERRKALFVRTLLPLVLRANAEIRGTRARVLTLMAKAGGDLAKLSPKGRAWLRELAGRYRLDEIDFELLKRRVDEVPVALALAQAAIESGWGSSRFAREGNALFGQWTWDTSKGMAPKERQKGKGEYGVRRFETLGRSVAAYMHNLNSHPAYLEFRKLRAAMRKQGQQLDAAALAGTLTRYSQRGQAYVDELRQTMRHNAFQAFAQTALARAPRS